MQSLLDPQEIVEDCEGMYEDAYGNVTKEDRDGLVLSDLEQDLMKMSNQPAIRCVYRRFVIVKSNADVHGRPGEQDWVSGIGSKLHVQTANPLAVSSASGSWFLGLLLATKSAPRVTRGIYIRRIYNVYNAKVVSLGAVTWTGYFGNSALSDLTGRSSHSP